MAGGYSVLNALNKNTRQQAEEKPQGRFRTKDISINDIYANEKNFYGTRDIESLAADIQAVGLLENLTVVYAPKDGRNYKLVGGERRWRALNLLVEQGYNEFNVATCQIRNADDDAEEVIEIIMCNRQRVKTAWEQLEEERRLKECLSAIKKRGGTVRGVDLQTGRLRDNIAKMLECSSTKVAQMETIINNLIPEFMEALKEQDINFSAAYVIAGMTPDQQQEALKRCRAAGGTITSAEAKAIKQEAENEQIPGKMDIENDFKEICPEESTEEGQETPEYGADQLNVESICYRCSHWAECIEKSSTTVKCTTFEDKDKPKEEPPAAVTQNTATEPQARIVNTGTGEVYENMKEAEKAAEEAKKEAGGASVADGVQEEKPEKVHYIRLAASYFDDVAAGVKTFELRKNDREYKTGDVLEMSEFKDGRNTGRMIRCKVTYMLEGYTGLTDGYCILGIKVLEVIGG